MFLVLMTCFLAVAPGAIAAERAPARTPEKVPESAKTPAPPRPVPAAPSKEDESAKDEVSQLFLSAERRDLDVKRRIALVVGNVRFVPPNSDRLIMADAGVIWFDRKEAYLEGNIRICKTFGPPLKPGAFDVPRPKLTERKGLEREESLEEAGDIDDVIEPKATRTILIDTRVPVSEADRVYVNWSDGTGYLVKPTLRFAEAERIANWVVTAPSATGIATYQVPIVDKSGKATGKYERQTHYVIDSPTFTTCTFKAPHTRFDATSAEWITDDYVSMRNMMFRFGDVPVMYLPYVYLDLEYQWPVVRAAAGHSSRLGTFFNLLVEFTPIRHFTVRPELQWMSERGLAYRLRADYAFGREKEIRGALDAFWLPSDQGTDFLADTGRDGSPWPDTWPDGPLGPLPDNIPLGEKNRYRVHYQHKQEYPEHWEVTVELNKFSDAGVYREFFEKEFFTEKPPENRLYVKYGQDNWAFFFHVNVRLDDFVDQTEYLPQVGFNWINQPLGGGFLFSTYNQLAFVRTRFANTRQRFDQTNLEITEIQLSEDEFRRPPALTLRENDTDELGGWRADTINTISRPFELGVFHIEPYIGWRGTWFQHGLSWLRGSYPDAPPSLPFPPNVAAAPDHTGSRFRSQVLAGAQVSTQFFRTYDVSDRPILSRLFPNGQRHIITPEITYTFESTPSVKPDELPQNDVVTEQRGLHKINFALRNRWETRWAPEIVRDPRAPVGGEWFLRKQAAELAEKSTPVNVIDLDQDIDLFLKPGRDNNNNLYDKRVRRFGNLRTNLAFHPSRKTTFFFDTELDPHGGSVLEVMSAGVKRQVSRDLALGASYSYHYHDAALLRFTADWEIDPKWHLFLDWQQDVGGRGAWDRAIELTRRFHEWELTVSYSFDRGRNENAFSFGIGPSGSSIYRPSWWFQPRSVAAFHVPESAR